MSRKKSAIYRRLTRPHLLAIGQVAVSWSLLERMVLSALSSLSGVRLDKAITLAGPAAFASWIDMLIILTGPSTEHAHKHQEIDKLGKLLKKLHTKRNYIVHAVWQIPRAGTGIIASEMYADPISTSKAEADGFPKRGTDWIKRVAWTPKQMRQIATMTEKCRSMLLEIQMRTPPTSHIDSLADDRRRQTNLRNMSLLSDRLPDTFRK